MRLLAGRGKKRIAKGEVVVLARPDSLGLERPAGTENMSEQWPRLITEQGWKPGDRGLLTTAKPGSRIPARVIYCERLSEKGFAVGLNLQRPYKKPRIQTKLCPRQ